MANKIKEEFESVEEEVKFQDRAYSVSDNISMSDLRTVDYSDVPEINKCKLVKDDTAEIRVALGDFMEGKLSEEETVDIISIVYFRLFGPLRRWIINAGYYTNDDLMQDIRIIVFKYLKKGKIIPMSAPLYLYKYVKYHFYRIYKDSYGGIYIYHNTRREEGIDMRRTDMDFDVQENNVFYTFERAEELDTVEKFKIILLNCKNFNPLILRRYLSNEKLVDFVVSEGITRSQYYSRERKLFDELRLLLKDEEIIELLNNILPRTR